MVLLTLMPLSWTCSTDKSNPNTSQICPSTSPALQHCFSAQTGLAEQCPSGPCPPSLPSWAPCTQAKAPMSIARAHTGKKVFLHFAECCGLGKAGWSAGKNLFFYIRNWMNMYSWQAESQGAEVSHSSNESCCWNIPANSFAAHILFDWGTGLPGKVSVSKTARLPSITPQVTSITWHVRRAEISHRCTSFEK